MESDLGGVHLILEGIKVIDFSQYIPGPYASLRLAEMGAEVINIEPLTGEAARSFGSQVEDVGLIYQANNYHKKSMALNLKNEEGQRLAKELIKKADVVIESFRPGVMKRFGIDYPSIKEIKPDIIYCSLTGYGQEGDMARLGSHDLNYLSVSGVLAQLKDRNNRPIIPSTTLADLIGGISASEQIVSSLFHREKTGEGQFIDFSIRDTMLSLMNTHIEIEQKTGKENGVSLLAGTIVCYNVYQSKEGRNISLAALEPKFWRNFCEAIEHHEWIPAQYSAATDENPIYQAVKKEFASRTFSEWAEFGLKVDCCLTPVFEVSELSNNPYLDNQEVINQGSSPNLGEHTIDLLKALLHKTDDEIALLKNKGII